MSDVDDQEPRTKVKSAKVGLSDRINPIAPVRDRARQKPAKKPGSKPLETPSDAVMARARPSISDDLRFEPQPKKARKIILWSFILVVLVPLFAAGVYFFAIASDQFTAEMRFAVRDTTGAPEGTSSTASATSSSTSTSSSPSTSTTSSPASILSSQSLVGQNAEIVASFIQSREAIDEVARSLNIRAIFQRPEADFWARLPQDSSPEKLVKYWKKMVDVYVDTTSGIVQVRATAFRREDALDLSRAILKACESLVRTMSLKIRTDLLNQAESEVRKSETDTRNAMKELTEFRNSHELVDPVKSADSTGQLLLQLMSSKIQTEAQLFVAERTGPNAPGIKAVRAQLASIDNHIDDLKQQLAGQKQTAKNMAATLAKFEELDLNRQFAERMLGYARTGLEQARIAAMQQMIYIAVFVQPALPEDYFYPMRATDTALIGLLFLMIWTTVTTFTASVLDHRI